MNDKYHLASKTINSGGIAFIRTDTQYGLLARADMKEVVEKVHRLKKRSKGKPFIILISSISDLNKFGVFIDDEVRSILGRIWPGPVSVILDVSKSSYSHLSENSLAFRIPNKEELLNLIQVTGPLIAPSANIEGENPSLNSDEAESVFGDEVDLYLDEGECYSNPSDLIEINGGKIKVIRGGNKINQKSNLKEQRLS